MEKISVYILIVACLSACSPSTEITASWKSPRAAEESINSIMVTALTDKVKARQTVENDLAKMLEKNGYRAVKSFDVIPPTFTASKEPDREALLEKISGTDVDAILTVALIDEETENKYVPGNYGYAPTARYSYYQRFWGYYNNWYPTLYAPGYYNEEKTYFIETNLYDAETEELLWSGQSETYNPRSLNQFSVEFAEVVVAKLKKDGALNRSVEKPLAKEKK